MFDYSYSKAGFLLGKMHISKGQTGQFISGLGSGSGGQCKDALLLVVVKTNAAATVNATLFA
jgi:hypothetical protein